eukprot:TRINITY_DN1748_c0_g1_i2.p1 TRINITY_DN1748_c0_g1~~TRINITY_DN1748_c0_g1_i2.p1  ORF type:complete len:373 (-),score=69.13 TRINITY_DN1748_c0_g1_i2:252-1370(-)
MLLCAASYKEICPIDQIHLVGNSLAAWPSALKNCRRIPHELRESKSYLRDKILCRESNGHVGNVQNNLAVGDYKGKHVALFRASDCVLDCGDGVIVDLPSWKALRDMLGTKRPEVPLTVKALLKLADQAEDEVDAGLAEEVKTEHTEDAYIGTPAAKKAKSTKDDRGPKAKWLAEELGEYPNSIRLVSNTTSEDYGRLVEEARSATLVAYDIQWSPDFEEGTDNPVALLQLSFPTTGNSYVLQLPLLGGVFPDHVKRLFESKDVVAVGFAANEIDVHKFQVSGVNIDTSTLIDVQPWCEAEMGENASVKQGWRVGLKRASMCVIDFGMDKTTTVASSNWEREELTTAQVEYAAMDVWVALRLYQRLASVYAV